MREYGSEGCFLILFFIGVYIFYPVGILLLGISRKLEVDNIK